MTTVDSRSQATQFIRSRLAELRSRLRSWIVVSGLGRWLWLVLGLLAADMVLDRFFRMDLPQRMIVLAGLLAGGAYLLHQKLLRPLSRRISDDGLLLEVERNNENLDQSLISSFQLAQQTDFESRGVSPQLAAATVETGVERARQVDFTSTLDLEQNKKNLLVLCSALVVVAGLAIGSFQNDFLRTWSRRNLLLTNDQWPQATYLEIVGAADGRLVVPRGVDHRQLVRVTENSRVKNVEVTLEADANESRTLQKMKPTGKEGGREHAFVFHSIATGYRIRALGGDATTDWVELELIEPPAILETELTALLPAYAGNAEQQFTGSGPHRVLSGSRLRVTARSNKPLKECNLKLDESTVVRLEPVDGSRLQFQTVLGETSGGIVGGKYAFDLVDDSSLHNIRDFSFTVKLGEDKPPVVRAKLLGISGLIVPRAIVPVEYTIEDDYGLTQLDFDCNWSSEESSAPSSLNFATKAWERTPAVSSAEDVAVLQVERLKLTPGTSLRFTLAATDNVEPKPLQGHSREFLLRVVSDEELRADLLRREIEQRKAFQQSYDAQMELIAEVRQVAAGADNSTVEEMNEQRQNKLVSLFRMQRGIGTSASMVAQRFEEFLVEVQNNRLDEETTKIDPTRTIEARFSQEIIFPIRQMDEELVTSASKNIDNCRRNLDNEANFRQSIEDTVAIQEQILERMRQIMASMESSESFQETVNRLLEIKRIEEGLRKQLDSKGNTKGIFDDE
jgi:hypothetical protein